MCLNFVLVAVLNLLAGNGCLSSTQIFARVASVEVEVAVWPASFSSLTLFWLLVG